jgi:hypothetical protein
MIAGRFGRASALFGGTGLRLRDLPLTPGTRLPARARHPRFQVARASDVRRSG